MRCLLLPALILLLFALPAHADVIADWNRMAARGADGKAVAPPNQDQATRSGTPLVALAMFEAANRIDHRYVSVLGLPPHAGTASATAAAAVAAHDVLVALQPERKSVLDEALLVSLLGLADDAALAAGRALGAETASAALKLPLFDGPTSDAYRPRGVPGEFAPPMPTILTPWSLRSQMIVLKSVDEAMPPPPPALSSAAYAASYNETKAIGGVGQPGATPQAKIAARFLAGFNLDEVVAEVAATKPRLVDRARLWALVRAAQHDANGMIAIAKMKYMTWRPYNAIRNGDRDGNPATTRDATWEPVLSTPNHPEYPCGHCTMSGLMAGLMAPETKGPVSVSSDSVSYPATMTFADWPAFLRATSLARIQGGMHFRFANDAGQAMGARIAELARTRFAPPLKPR